MWVKYHIFDYYTCVNLNNDKMKLIYWLSICIFCLYGTEAISASRADSTKSSGSSSSQLAELQKDINSLLDNPDFSNGFIGISIVSADNGDVIYKYNDYKNFIPASTQKVLTTSAALEFLGRDFRYNTSLYLDGEIYPGGEFNGNIIIRGTGDPSFSTKFVEDPLDIFDAWTKTLDSLGITSIRGNIIGDDDYFDDTYYPSGWAWDDMVYPFSAQINALSVYDNRIDVVIEQGDSIGALAKIKVVPENNYIKLINKVRTVSDSGLTEVMPEREVGSNIIEVYGAIKFNSKKKESTVVSVTIDNPTLFFLSLLKDALDRRRINFRGALLDIDDCNETFSYMDKNPTCENVSPSLSEIVKKVNKSSDNLIAETLMKTIAKEVTGRGSFSLGIDQIEKFAVRAGLSPERMSVADGSGLSRANYISPRYQTLLLQKVYRSDIKDDILASLALPGEKGTLKNRLTRSRAEKNVWAKTGSMTGVATLCGYVTTKDNETMAFSIMIMNHSVSLNTANNLIDLICMRVASFSRKRS